jgi:hypothetical protein
LNFGNGIGGTGVNNSTSSQFSGQFQNASATQITATVGQTASVNGFDYAVNSIKSVGPKYIDMYDQRGTPLHPKWKTDTLVVVDISETNRGTTAVPAPTSGWFDISVFDGQKIGYRASYLDMMRSSDVVTADNGEEDMYSQADTGSSNLMIGPGGTLHFAAIASVPKDRHINSVMISVSPGGSGSSNGPSAIVTVNQ